MSLGEQYPVVLQITPVSEPRSHTSQLLFHFPPGLPCLLIAPSCYTNHLYAHHSSYTPPHQNTTVWASHSTIPKPLHLPYTKASLSPKAGPISGTDSRSGGVLLSSTRRLGDASKMMVCGTANEMAVEGKEVCADDLDCWDVDPTQKCALVSLSFCHIIRQAVMGMC